MTETKGEYSVDALCPFCGKANYSIERTGAREVTLRCRECGFWCKQKVLRQTIDSLEDAMRSKWNKRPIEDALRAERDALAAQLAQAREVLRAVEWSGEWEDYETGAAFGLCPSCKRLDGDSHAPGCKLAQAIGEG